MKKNRFQNFFLQRDPETDEIINGQILIDPTISSSELEK